MTKIRNFKQALKLKNISATKTPRHKGLFKQNTFLMPLCLCGNFWFYPGQVAR